MSSLWTSAQVLGVSVLSGIGGAVVAWRLLGATVAKAAAPATSSVSASAVVATEKTTSPYLTDRRTPNAKWTPGDKQPCPLDDGKAPSFLSSPPTELKSPYFFTVSAFVPRPIALIGTVSKAGVPNLSTYSYFGVMGHDPLTLAFTCCTTKRTRPYPHHKDTLSNILETGECTVQIISSWMVDAANHTCGNWQPDQDEFELSGLTKLPSKLIKPSRVGESALQFECKLLETRDMINDNGEKGGVMVLVKVVMVHINEQVYDSESGTIDLEKLDPVSRCGGNTYGLTRDAFDIRRPGSAGADRDAAMKAVNKA